MSCCVLNAICVDVAFPAKLESSFVSPIDRMEVTENIEFSIRSSA